MKRGFTLMELLIVILIIGLLVGLSVAALVGAAEQARESRTRSIIAKLDQLISAKYDSYRTRRLPIRTTGARPKSELFSDGDGDGFWDAGESFTDSNGNGVYDFGAAYYRLMALREVMRMELPDRVTDVVHLSSGNMEVTATGMPQAALQRMYYRKVVAAVGVPSNWTPQHQGSECLYLIVSAMHDGDKNALDFFSPDEIGDTDGDGMREILDGWGRPIGFLRWAPAFTRANVGQEATQNAAVDANGVPLEPDPFDPVNEDARATFALRPLIVSGGRDGVVDMALDFGSSPYRASQNRNDPYYIPASPLAPLGTVNIGGNGEWLDNLTNHSPPPNL